MLNAAHSSKLVLCDLKYSSSKSMVSWLQGNLDLYEDIFEKPFLAATGEYYRYDSEKSTYYSYDWEKVLQLRLGESTTATTKRKYYSYY